MNELELFQALFRMDGERVINRETGKEVGRPRRGMVPSGYPQVSVLVDGKRRSFRLHRVKFGLLNGFLPPRVDHKNRNIRDNSGVNLRASNAAQNAWNRDPFNSKRGLPVGVNHRRGRFRAYSSHLGKLYHLGTFGSVEEAAAVVGRFNKSKRGEFHPDQ